MRVAVVQGENVINVIEVESLDQQEEFRSVGLIPEDAELVETDEAGLGWHYDGENFHAPLMEPETRPADGV